MTVFTTTITNTVRVFGPEPTEKWASAATSSALIYGSDNWGYGTVGLPITFQKGITNSFAVTGESDLAFFKSISNSQEITNTVGKTALKTVANSFPVTNTIGKTASKSIFNSAPISTTVSKMFDKMITNDQSLSDSASPVMSWSRTLYGTFSIASELDAYEYRSGYSVLYGGVSSVVDWPRPQSLTQTTLPVTTWTVASAVSSSWS